MIILLFGASGMLGNYLYSYFKDKCICVYRSDLTDLSYSSIKYIFDLYSINNNYVVINCIGLITQTGIKSSNDYININSIFPNILSSICNEYNCQLIHPTTDCVYSGNKGLYDENDIMDETGIYGITKSLGEPQNACVIRTSIIGEEINHKYSIVEWVKKNANSEVNGYTNHFWNGITCLQFCKIVDYMINNNLYWKGVRHIFSPDIVSKCELIELINDEYNLNIKINKHETETKVDKTLVSKYDTYKIFDIPSMEQQIKEMHNFKFYNKNKKTIMTLTGIRPDFIRMAEIFKKLDENFNHILVHSGQHYDKLLSDVFFEDLEIRKPDYILDVGKNASNHYEQLSYLSTAIIKLINDNNLKPDLIIFLGDSNTAAVSMVLKKEGYKIGHVEAGMRSFDKRMLEEINRTVCDHCSDFLFVYHPDYKKYLENENIRNNVYIVGNTIVEVANKFIGNIINEPKRNDCILLDIHRPENYKYKHRLVNIIKYANECINLYGLPVKILKFFGTCKNIKDWNIDLGNIELIDLMSYKKYLNTIYHCKFIISDSGTAQEEPALFNTPVIVPRDYTERPQSVDADCSYMLNVNTVNDTWTYSHKWILNNPKMNKEWMGNGNTANSIVNILKNML